MTFRYSLQVMTVALGVSAASAGAVYAQASDAPASDAPTSATKLSPADQQFVQDASMSDATEIAASKLALKNSSDPHVKKFAQQMITDHTKLSNGMSMLARKKGLATAPSADSALVGKLQTLKGKEFDQAYVEQVGLEAHQRAVDLFTQESQSGTDSQLKAAAAHALPTIKHLAGAMKGSS
jgi:putative membrane protein